MPVRLPGTPDYWGLDHVKVMGIGTEDGHPILAGERLDRDLTEVDIPDGALILRQLVIPDLPSRAKGSIVGAVYRVVDGQLKLVAQTSSAYYTPGWQNELVEHVRPYLTP